VAARPLLERSLAIFGKALGEEHFYTAFPLAGLAELDHRSGELARAEERFRRALELGERGLGAGHPDLAEIRRAYAALLRDLGRERDATAVESGAGTSSGER
jgi:tetratricopeptide (TPR) repeat protein